MQKRILTFSALVLIIFLVGLNSCSKLDTTTIGSDLLPVVDNVNTFDTILQINTSQGYFNNDSTIISSLQEHALGKITNDPLFGTTQASIYAQFKPAFYPYYYGNPNDTINNSLAPGTGFDSAVLCLSYRAFWGDSIGTPFTIQVKEVAHNAGSYWDSLGQAKYTFYAPPTTGSVIGSTTVNVANLYNWNMFANHKDSTLKQIRIKLSPSFANTLFNRDTAIIGNNSFYSDSLFRLFQNGFAITATNGNGLLYTALSDTATRLEVHYRRKNGGVIDTTFSSLLVNTTTANTYNALSATVNNIVRNRTGFPVMSPTSNELYLQTTPGTFANLTIPGLSSVSNRIIHRAEIVIEQIPTNPITDGYFTAPNYLYLDLKDTGTTLKYKTIYYDLNPAATYDPDNILATFYPTTAGIDYLYHGGFVRPQTDAFGNATKYYNFNITRYVQQIITKHTYNYPLRLYAPFELSYPQYYPGTYSYNNRLCYGRIKVGSGTNANYKMRLRLIYSKI